MFTNLQAAGWDKVGEAKEKGLFDFDFITWMAWTWPTAFFFYFYSIMYYRNVFLGKKRSRWFAA